MYFAGLLKQSLVDYPGKICSVLFTEGCNFRCGFCQNKNLVEPALFHLNNHLDEDSILAFLEKRKNFIEAITITGGEPTLHPELLSFISKVKNLGFAVKLDTNGTNPKMLESLIKKGLIDYVAMDIKAPLDYQKYKDLTGNIISSAMFSDILHSLKLILDAPESIFKEFRTTLIKEKHPLEDITDIAEAIKGCHRYALQSFRSSTVLSPEYSEFSPYSEQEMQEIARKISSIVNVVVR